jgi:hypothetical protein
MLDEYKTSDLFWVDAIKTACHAINRLYLHKKLKKTSYEILTGNKPKVSYFRVFGCKCFILNKRPKTSKFAPKVDEGILLGYGSNEHAYRIFNKALGRIEVMVDVTFDESNGSQVGQVDSSVVEKEDPPCKAIKQMLLAMLGHEKIKLLMMRILKLLLHQFPLTYSTEKGSTHLRRTSRAAVPPLRATVMPPPPWQQLIQLLHQHFKG